MDFQSIKQGFEKKYFIPSHIKFNYDTGLYQTKYDGELFEKLAVQTNNMFSIWRDACIYASSLNVNQ
ncbi:hypothetical protein FWP33_18775 [Vibrio parahaemolyticus]|nr:hypothetical protein [Vibrio parahaemolyticus]EJE4724661.1 hypothetical protein [Vibrio parahaemolyticus]EJO2026024.1 hypothetical protein [Vibrio parahaemolyticus]